MKLIRQKNWSTRLDRIESISKTKQIVNGNYHYGFQIIGFSGNISDISFGGAHSSESSRDAMFDSITTEMENL